MIGSASGDTDVTRGAHAHLLFCEAPPLRVHYCLRQFFLSTVVFSCYTVYSITFSCCLAVRRLVHVKLRSAVGQGTTGLTAVDSVGVTSGEINPLLE